MREFMVRVPTKALDRPEEACLLSLLGMKDQGLQEPSYLASPADVVTSDQSCDHSHGTLRTREVVATRKCNTCDPFN